jgi:AbrB family looped-hinge helix DNA binding protein
MQIEERTVLRVGGSSLMVTLPKGWLRCMGIKAGDKVEVITNGEIVIRRKRRKSSSERRKQIIGVSSLDENEVSQGGQKDS